MTVHDIKVHPQYFNAIADGSKPFEVRKDDRGYAVGDVLRLREWDPAAETAYHALGYENATEAAYTGRVIERVITYRLALADWPAADTVMGLSRGAGALRYIVIPDNRFTGTLTVRGPYATEAERDEEAQMCLWGDCAAIRISFLDIDPTTGKSHTWQPSESYLDELRQRWDAAGGLEEGA